MSFARSIAAPFFWLSLLVALTSAAEGPPPAKAPKPVWNFQIGDPFPPAALEAIGGGRISLPPVGSPTVINFFATWCGPCRMEMPELEREIAQVFRTRGVRVIGVDRGETMEIVRPFAEKLGIGYPLVVDSDKRLFNSISGDGLGIPKTLLLDEKGRIVWRENGFVPGETIVELRRQIEMLLPAPAGRE